MQPLANGFQTGGQEPRWSQDEYSYTRGLKGLEIFVFSDFPQMTFNTLKPLKMTKVNNLLPVYSNTQQLPSDMFPGVLVWTEIISDYNAYLDGVIQKILILFHSCFFWSFLFVFYSIFDACVACL